MSEGEGRWHTEERGSSVSYPRWPGRQLPPRVLFLGLRMLVYATPTKMRWRMIHLLQAMTVLLARAMMVSHPRELTWVHVSHASTR